MTHVAAHAQVPATSAGRGAAAAPAEQLETLQWEGAPQGWWSRNGATVGFTAGGALFGGLAAAMIRMNTALPGANPARSVAIVGGAALGAAVLAGGLTHWLRGRDDRVPDPPRAVAPVLPPAGSVPDVAGGELRAGSHVGHGDGSYTETHTHSRPDGRGGTESYTETHTHHFSWDVGVEKQVGRREGYTTVHDALRDLTEGGGVAIRRQGDRYVTYDLQDRSHWSDLDDLRVDDVATEAIVSPGGRVWMLGPEGREFERVGETSRMDPTGSRGETIGEYELRHRGNPGVELQDVRSGLIGHESLPTALAEIAVRPGDQAIVARHGRYHVLDVRSPELDRTIPNDGFVTTRHAPGVVAVEQQGGVWSPLGDWYVKPRQLQ